MGTRSGSSPRPQGSLGGAGASEKGQPHRRLRSQDRHPEDKSLNWDLKGDMGQEVAEGWQTVFATVSAATPLRARPARQVWAPRVSGAPQVGAPGEVGFRWGWEGLVPGDVLEL